MYVDLIGWAATAVFVSSYLRKDPAALRRTQALGAVLWMVYGVFLHAVPVIVANVIVAGAALAGTRRVAGQGGSPDGPQAGPPGPRGEAPGRPD